MSNELSRKDFIKLLSLGLAGQFLPRVIHQPLFTELNNDHPNILILVFDAWTAENTSLFGYPRKTMPYLEKLAEKAIVFHNHYAGGPFTSPGTATLISGRYPWSHRSINRAGKMDYRTAHQNFFRELKDEYFQIAYTHNSYADYLLRQQRQELDQYLPRPKFYLDKDPVFDNLLSNDFEAANMARQTSLFDYYGLFQSTLFLQRLYLALRKKYPELSEDVFPRGVPQMGDSAQRFILEDGIDWLGFNLKNFPQPFLGYFHFLPPHAPYHTRREFINQFEGDGFKPVDKPVHPLALGSEKEEIIHLRRMYDEFLLYVDFEFKRLYENLDRQGLLDNLWIILTSDHGELFERGEIAHATRLLYQPVVKIPLLIFPPGLSKRLDVHANTSAADILPTILKLAGKEIPEWCEGTPLPIGGDGIMNDRPVFSVQAQHNPKYEPLEEATFMMVLEDYKIIKTIGYPMLEDGSLTEVYDLRNDPEELVNLVKRQPKIAKELEALLDKKIEDVNRPYKSG